MANRARKIYKKNNEQQLVRLYKLNELLTLPLLDNPRLDYEKKYWRSVVNAYLKFEQLLSLKYKGEKIDPLLLQEGAALLGVDFSYDKQKIANLSAWSYKAEEQYLYKLPPVSAFNLPLLRRCKDSLKALSIFLTTLGLWMYIPIPGAYMMPLIGAVCAIVITPLPSQLIRYTGISAIVTAIIILAQLVFIMPLFTEAWQIAGLYFFNVLMIYKISEIPGLELQKLIGGNLAVVYGMGALQITPSYDVIAPLLMVIFMLITLGIVAFYCKLFHSP